MSLKIPFAYPTMRQSTSHNAPFCNTNVHMCAHFCYAMVLWGIFDAFWELSDRSIKSFANSVFGLTDPYLMCLSVCKYWVGLMLSGGWLKISAVERFQHYTKPVNRINGLWNYSLKGEEVKSWMIIHNATLTGHFQDWSTLNIQEQPLFLE